MIDDQLRWTRFSLIDEAKKSFKALNIGDAARNVEWILCELLNCDRASLIAYPEKVVPGEVVVQFKSMLKRRLANEPLQYILGYTEFCGLRFQVTPDVLIPRPETELLIEHVTHFFQRKNHQRHKHTPEQTMTALDIGSGSGCIPVAIKHFNKDVDVYSCDVSRPALEIAAHNAKQAGLPVTFFHCDILTPLLPFSRKFDIIVSNPPYIPHSEYATLDPEVLNFEPQLALDAGNDPLVFYRAISRVAASHLHPEGMVFFETHCDYARDVADHLTRQGFSEVQILKDLAGLDRFVNALKK